MIGKNFLLLLIRHPISTLSQCLILPILVIAVLSFARNLFIPPSHYGVGSPQSSPSLYDVLIEDTSDRDTVVFATNGFRGGNIDRVIASVATVVADAGKDVKIIDREQRLRSVCRSSIRGTSNCFAAAIFYGSPAEGPSGTWNYTLMADGALGQKIDVTSPSNDAQLYVLPLQRAIDSSIATIDNSTSGTRLSDIEFSEYVFTSQTQKQHTEMIRTNYMISRWQLLKFFLCVCRRLD